MTGAEMQLRIMNNKEYIRTLSLLILAALIVSACSINIDRNEDGSLRLETTMTEEAIKTQIKAALADPAVQDLEVDLREGYILVTGERKRDTDFKTDTMSFRLDLGASEGHMTAVISDAQINGIPIAQERVATWNERMAAKLESAGQKNDSSTLEAVTVNSDAVTMIWRVETQGSRRG